MISLSDLSYQYHNAYAALDNISASIGPGIHLLLGENGAGKTTLLRLLAGLLTPSSGTCTIDSEPSDCREPSLLKRIFFMPDTMEIPTRSIKGFCNCHSRFYDGFSYECFEENLKDFGLTGDETFSQLSLGLRHKSLLAYVVALGVDILLLDEPANGLDIMSKKTLRKILARSITESQTVIISTHTITDLRELYDGILVLSHGHLLLASPTWEISQKIACTTSAIPNPEALYVEQGPGVFYSLCVNPTGEPSDIYYGLLYSSLMSPRSQEVLDAINRP